MPDIRNLPSFIQENVSLKPYNTFGISVLAKYFSIVSSLEELLADLKFAEEQKLPILPLGGGSNVLFLKDFEGLVLQVALKGIAEQSFGANEVLVTAAAGENWHEFVQFTLDKGWYGLENLSLIPGCVGAAPMQNIGAYGVEIKDHFHSLQALLLESKQVVTITNEQCQFGYRESIFKRELKGKVIILSVSFILSKVAAVATQYGAIQDTLKEMGIEQPTPLDVSKAVVAIRQSKLPDPKEIGNAGSFFKNPEISIEQFKELQQQNPEMPHYPTTEGLIKVPAGWLIERAGWKGYVRDNYGVHKKQALVLVNYGNASGAAIWQLSQDIIADIKQKFGVTLSAEVNVV